MRKHNLIIAAALLTLGTVGTANATTMSAPAGLRAAIDDTSMTEAVHCIPGVRHWHRWGWGTGCGRVFIAPRVYHHYGFAHRFHRHGHHRHHFRHHHGRPW